MRLTTRIKMGQFLLTHHHSLIINCQRLRPKLNGNAPRAQSPTIARTRHIVHPPLCLLKVTRRLSKAEKQRDKKTKKPIKGFVCF
jgi:hypothetical protein